MWNLLAVERAMGLSAGVYPFSFSLSSKGGCCLHLYEATADIENAQKIYFPCSPYYPQIKVPIRPVWSSHYPYKKKLRTEKAYFGDRPERSSLAVIVTGEINSGFLINTEEINSGFLINTARIHKKRGGVSMGL